MLRYLIILLLPLTLFSQTEEKRLALVIGNSNYDKGPLNNPVNDALLMARTLDSLDFDVIIDTNIANKENFIRTIREFGNKRSDYDVAFVYYAGHGIQVGAENFLLPTKVNFETEYDVMDFGVSVQNIMRYLTGMTNQVNILVLDACRDNPFEGNWNKTRSLKGGGLAKIPPPTGSLIAFSTDAGNTAADGNGVNSIYCQSLCKNMMLDNTSLDQVFRNVRSDVLKITNGNQRPVEASQLTGQAFYLNGKKDKLSFQDYYANPENIIPLPKGWRMNEVFDIEETLSHFSEETRNKELINSAQSNWLTPINYYKYDKDFPAIIPTIGINIKLSKNVVNEFFPIFSQGDSLIKLTQWLTSSFNEFDNFKIIENIKEFDIGKINDKYHQKKIAGYRIIFSYNLYGIGVKTTLYLFEYQEITYQLSFNDILPGDYTDLMSTYKFSYMNGNNGEDNSEIFNQSLKRLSFFEF